MGDDAEDNIALPPEQPLTCVAYLASFVPRFFLEPFAVGDSLPEMPLFLTDDIYVPIPLDATYLSAWEAVPDYWRDVLDTPAPAGP